MIPAIASVRLVPVMLPEMLDGLPVMLPDLPVMFPAKAEEEMAKVKRDVQRIDLKRFIFNSPGNLTVYWGLFARAGLATFADVKSRSSEQLLGSASSMSRVVPQR